jgi:hypothetical protein
VSDSDFNPRNTQSIPAVKIFVFLELEQNWTFRKSLYLRRYSITFKAVTIWLLAEPAGLKFSDKLDRGLTNGEFT